MIISRTPVRTSFLGGGSDTIENVNRSYGLVLGAAIQQYSFVTARYLPQYSGYKTRLSYSKIETVNDNSEIEHRVIKSVLEYLDITDGVEIGHESDIPGKSGLGSSSSFLVGLLNSLCHLKGLTPSKMDLYLAAVDIEQNFMKETIGLQDSMWAVYGGLATVKFTSMYDMIYRPFFLTTKELERFESHIMLFYTKTQRMSSEIAAKYYPTMTEKSLEMDAIVELARQGRELIKRKDYLGLGNLLGESWKLKKSLHPDISNTQIDEINEIISNNSGYSKVSGAGGGGSILAIIPPEKRQIIKAEVGERAIEIPVKIDYSGSTIIYKV